MMENSGAVRRHRNRFHCLKMIIRTQINSVRDSVVRFVVHSTRRAMVLRCLVFSADVHGCPDLKSKVVFEFSNICLRNHLEGEER